MKRETYKGRKLQTTKGTDYGYSRAKVNGVDLGTHLGGEDAALAWMKRTIDYADETGLSSGRHGAEWFAPGTFELCDVCEGTKEIGGECGHSYCVSRRLSPASDKSAEETEDIMKATEITRYTDGAVKFEFEGEQYLMDRGGEIRWATPDGWHRVATDPIAFPPHGPEYNKESVYADRANTFAGTIAIDDQR